MLYIHAIIVIYASQMDIKQDICNSINLIGVTNTHINVPIKMHIDVLIHQMYIDVIIKVNIPYLNGKWVDHPFMILNKNSITNVYSNRITKTRATLTMLSELLTPISISIDHISDCTHRAQLIAALDHFWH